MWNFKMQFLTRVESSELASPQEFSEEPREARRREDQGTRKGCWSILFLRDVSVSTLELCDKKLHAIHR